MAEIGSGELRISQIDCAQVHAGKTFPRQVRPHGVALPYGSVEALRAAYDFANLQDFLDIYYRGASVLREERDFYDLTRAYLERARSEAVLQVGHIVRYDPVTVAIGALKDFRPRFIEVNRVSPMTFRSVDIGVVLDMMIHDIDVLLMLLGAEPVDVQANAVSVIGVAEDVCNARLTFPPGDDGISCVANMTASRLALKTERKIRLISEDAYVSADFAAQRGTVVRKQANAEQLEDVRRRLAAGPHEPGCGGAAWSQPHRCLWPAGGDDARVLLLHPLPGGGFRLYLG